MFKSVPIGLSITCLCLVAGSSWAADGFAFPPQASKERSALEAYMPELARQLTAQYQENDRRKFLDMLFRLQLVAGEYPAAAGTLASLRELEIKQGVLHSHTHNLQYELLARAKVRQSESEIPFEEAFRHVFSAELRLMDDRTSSLFIRALTPQYAHQQNLRDALDSQQDQSRISLADALELVRVYQIDDAYRTLATLASPLIAADDARRYHIDKDIPVRTADGATVCTLIVRPRSASGRLPSLLLFTIYADARKLLSEARRAAAHGYAGIVGFTRGKGCSPDTPVPYEHDSSDAAAVIDWISVQPWSDGRVGMYGGSYAGFTQWAAAKKMPKALKALMPQAPVAPAIDVPMEGNVFWSFVFPWTFYTTNVRGLDEAPYSNRRHWNQLYREWYVSGRAYRDLDKLEGTPNPLWQKWIAHPSYDAYWQRQIAYEKDFARIDIPVLTTAGYYYGGPGSAVYYFTQHYEHRPNAQHYLVIGPYNHIEAQLGTVDLMSDTTDNIAGYTLDPVAQIDLGALRFEWFDYVLRGGPKPALLKDKVNYQVTGANVWKHAPSLAAMASQRRRVYLSRARTEQGYRLADKAHPSSFVPLTVDLADRTDIDRAVPKGGVSTTVETANGVKFVSEPLPEAKELSGLFSGQLEFSANKPDFDFNIGLYELTAAGEYIELAPYWTRASYAADLRHRRLLVPDKRQRIEFKSMRLMSRFVGAGSRLVAVFSVIKEPGRQVNYGSGKDVSAESIADAGSPLVIRWFGNSFVDIPIAR